jgi:hypothetical protein
LERKKKSAFGDGRDLGMVSGLRPTELLDVAALAGGICLQLLLKVRPFVVEEAVDGSFALGIFPGGL